MRDIHGSAVVLKREFTGTEIVGLSIYPFRSGCIPDNIAIAIVRSLPDDRTPTHLVVVYVRDANGGRRELNLWISVGQMSDQEEYLNLIGSYFGKWGRYVGDRISQYEDFGQGRFIIQFLSGGQIQDIESEQQDPEFFC